MKITYFTTALAAMAFSLTKAVPVNAATEAEMFGLHKLLSDVDDYCQEKLEQADEAARNFLLYL